MDQNAPRDIRLRLTIEEGGDVDRLLNLMADKIERGIGRAAEQGGAKLLGVLADLGEQAGRQFDVRFRRAARSIGVDPAAGKLVPEISPHLAAVMARAGVIRDPVVEQFAAAPQLAAVTRSAAGTGDGDDLSRRLDSSLLLSAQRLDERLQQVARAADVRSRRFLRAAGVDPTGGRLFPAGDDDAALLDRVAAAAPASSSGTAGGAAVAAMENERRARAMQRLGLLDAAPAPVVAAVGGGGGGNAVPPFGAAAAGAGDAGLRMVDPADLELAARAARQFGDDAEAAGRKGGRGFNLLGREVESVRSGVGAVRGGIVQFAAALYTVEAAAGTLKRVLVDPVADLTRHLYEAHEAALKFQISLSGVAGAAKAQEVSSLLTARARGLPIPLADLRGNATTLASIPALAGGVASGSASDVVDQTLQLSTLTRRLAAIDPEQGNQGATVAIRELLEGGPGSGVSLRRRFGFSPQQLARQVGRSIDDLAADPQLAVSGLERLAEVLVPDSVLEQQSQLISTRLGKLGDAFTEAADKIASSGVYRQAGERLKAVQRDLYTTLDSPEFAAAAQRISDNLSTVLDNSGDAVNRFLAALSGRRDASGFAGAVGAAEAVLSKLADGTSGLPDLASRLGDGLNAVASAVGSAAENLGSLADLLTGSTLLNKLAPERRESYRLAAVGRSLEDLGLPGVTAGRSVVGYRPAQVWESPESDPKAVRRDSGEYVYPKYASTPDVSGVASPRLQALAERAVAALPEDALPVELAGDKRMVAALLRQRVPDFESVLAQARGLPDPALTPTETPLPPRLKEFVDSEYDGPNFGATTLAANGRLGNLSDLAGGRDDLADLRTAAGGAADALRVFGQLRRQYGDAMVKIQGANDDAAALPADDYRRADLMGLAQKASDVAGQRYNAAVGLSADTASDAALAYGLSLAQALAAVPLSADAFAPIRDGTTAFARRVADALDEAGRAVDPRRLGSAGMSLPAQQAVVRAGVQRRLDDEKLAQRVGVIAPGDSAAEIEQARRTRPDAFQSAGRQAAFIRESALPQQAEVLGRANNALAAAPDDPLALRDAAEAASDYGQLLDLMHQLEGESSRVRAAFVEMGEAGGAAIQQGLGDVFYSLLTDINSVEDALRRIPAALARAFADVAAKQAMTALFSLATNGLGGLLGGGLGAANAAAATTVGKTAVANSVQAGLAGGFGGLAAADGGVFAGGFTPLGESAGSRGWTGQPVRAFADGGLVSAPTLGLVGEAGYPEAVIPLRHGNVPVEMRGGGGGHGPIDASVEFIVVSSEEEAFMRQLQSRKARSIIGTVATSKMVQTGGVRRGER